MHVLHVPSQLLGLPSPAFVFRVVDDTSGSHRRSLPSLYSPFTCLHSVAEPGPETPGLDPRCDKEARSSPALPFCSACIQPPLPFPETPILLGPSPFFRMLFRPLKHQRGDPLLSSCSVCGVKALSVVPCVEVSQEIWELQRSRRLSPGVWHICTLLLVEPRVSSVLFLPYPDPGE